MGVFSKAPYPSPSRLGSVGENYRRQLSRNPFLSFGLPFILVMVAGSFFLTPATAVRYEKYDRKTHMLDRDEALGLGRVKDAGRARGAKGGRDIREEYWRLAGKGADLDDWEPKRVERLPGEPDGTFE